MYAYATKITREMLQGKKDPECDPINRKPPSQHTNTCKPRRDRSVPRKGRQEPALMALRRRK